MLVAVAVVVPLTLASAMGLLTSIRSSEDAEQRQELNVALSNATETLRTLPYLPCAGPDEYQKLYRGAELPRAGDEMRVGAQLAAPSIESVHYWDEQRQAYVERCEQDGGAQQVRLTVISDRLGTATGTVVLTDLQDTGGAQR